MMWPQHCLLTLQWKGLPYGECTWEKYDDILKAGGPDNVQQLKVSCIVSPCGLFCPCSWLMWNL